MDANLTHAIAVNVILTQPLSQNSGQLNALLAIAAGTISALIAAAVSYHNTKKVIDSSLQGIRETIDSTIRMNKETIDASIKNNNETIKLEKFKILQDELQENYNKRQEAYSQLLGRKRTMLQSYVSYYSLFVSSKISRYNANLLALNSVDFKHVTKLLENPDHREAANKYINLRINSEIEKSPDEKEGLRMQQSCERLELEKAKYIERFYETIGLINRLFPQQVVQGLVKKIEKTEMSFEKFEEEIIKNFDDLSEELANHAALMTSNEERRDWVAQKESELHDLISAKQNELKNKEKDLNLIIDELLNNLDAVIKEQNTEEAEGKHGHLDHDSSAEQIDSVFLESP